MKKALFVGLLLIALLILAWVFIPEGLPSDVREAIVSSDKPEFYSLDPVLISRRDVPDTEPTPVVPPEKNFHGYEILAHAQISESEKQTLLKELTPGFYESWRRMNGFIRTGCIIEPRHALRVQQKGHTFDVLICYHCGQIKAFRDDREVVFFEIAGMNPDQANQILDAHGLPRKRPSPARHP